MRKISVKILIPIIAIISFFGLARGAMAMGGGFDIIFSPKYSGPGAPVQVMVQSYDFDVNGADIVWKVDGKIAAGGKGVKFLQVVAPELGKASEISAYVKTADGFQTSRMINLRGNDVDFLWEALTYTPSWYKGKALPVVGSNIRITAVPHLFSGEGELSADSLIYEWSLDYNKSVGGSGVGKKSFVINLNRPIDNIITVKVSNIKGDIVFEKGITFNPEDNEPEVAVYKEDFLGGISQNKAITGDFKLIENEVNFRAEPFFFPRKDLNKLSYGWTINGKPAQTESTPNFLSLRYGGAAGNAVLDLFVNNAAGILQSARKSFALKF